LQNFGRRLDHLLQPRPLLDVGPVVGVQAPKFAEICRVVCSEPTVDLITVQSLMPVNSDDPYDPEPLRSVMASTDKPVLGFGRIARSLVQLATSFGMKGYLAFDPHVDQRIAAQHGVEIVGLDELLAKSDFVSIHCPLDEQTRNLIGKNELNKMKPEAFLINTARGGIVDEQALYTALKERRIAGAAVDVFTNEPLTQPHPLAEFDNVLLAPHCIAWTEELFSDIGKAVCQAMIDLSHGDKPRGMVNPVVLQHPAFKKKWERWGGG
jgi:lactate dehydrogenase-like 2-hydroxyacid dehydrogenase